VRNPTWQQVATTHEVMAAIVTAALNYTRAWHAADDVDPDKHPHSSAAAYDHHLEHADDALAVIRQLAAILIGREEESPR